MTPEVALINAIRTLLKASESPIKNMVGQNVFDQVDTTTKPPYVYIGPAGRTRRLDIDCFEVWTQRLRIYVIYLSWDRTQVWEAAEAIIQALDLLDAEKGFVLATPFSLQEPLKITQAGDVIDPTAPKSVFVDLTTTIARAS